jgi:hypothetical protein
MYNCRFQIYRINKEVPRRECYGCSADSMNNPKCPDYASIRFEDLAKIPGRTFVAIGKLEEKV